MNFEGTWTHFWDMHSGGSCKEPPFEHIYIQAPKEEAKRAFYGRFGHNPERVTCTCCGEDYSISEGTLAEVTGHQRGAAGTYFDAKGAQVEFYDIPIAERKHLTHRYIGGRAIQDYITDKNVLLVAEEDIAPEWRTAHVPRQGYVWVEEGGE